MLNAPPLARYPTQPPTSGPHDAGTVAAGFYDQPPDIYRAIHSLEHAAVIVWYAPSTKGTAELNSIKSETAGASRQSPGSKRASQLGRQTLARCKA